MAEGCCGSRLGGVLTGTSFEGALGCAFGLCLVLQVGIVTSCGIAGGSWHPLHPTAQPGCWPPALLYTPAHPCSPSSPALITPCTIKYPRTSATTAAPPSPASPPTQHCPHCLHPSNTCTPSTQIIPAPTAPSHRHHLGKLRPEAKHQVTAQPPKPL